MNKFHLVLSHYILPMGLFFALTGMLYFSSMGAYHSLTYLFFILPALFLSMTDKDLWVTLWSSLSFRLLLLFLTYLSLSLLWNDPQVIDLKLLKRVFIILFFIIGLVLLANKDEEIIIKILLLSAYVFALVAYYSFPEHYFVFVSNYYEGNGIIGQGNLSNPLLSSHVYGVFTVIVMIYFLSVKRDWKKDSILLIIFAGLLSFVILTKSRTPLVALSCVFLYLLWVYRNKFVLYFISTLIVFAITYFTLNYEILTERGLSFRPEIWTVVLEEVADKPVFGAGFGTGILIYIEEIQANFSDTHSLYIGLLYNLGMMGLLLWLAFIATLLVTGLKNKTSKLAHIGVGVLLYGMAAGLTEGTNFISRPKEVWFLVWLPVALLFAADYKRIKSGASI